MGYQGMAAGKGQNQFPHGFRLGCEVSGQLQPGEGRPLTELWTRELGLEVLGLDSPPTNTNQPRAGAKSSLGDTWGQLLVDH